MTPKRRKRRKRKQWGGAREGAGRPPGPKTVRLTIHVEPSQLEALDVLAQARGLSRSEVVRAWLNRLAGRGA